MDQIYKDLLSISQLIKATPKSFQEITDVLYSLQLYMEKAKLTANMKLTLLKECREILDQIAKYIKNKRMKHKTRNGELISMLSFKEKLLDAQFNYTPHLLKLLDKTAHIFSEFMKGITYFKGQDTDVGRPIYHRTTSCGPRNDKDFKKNNLNCNNIGDAYDEFERRRLNVRNCLLERFIYDQLFNRYYDVPQDDKHIYQMHDIDRYNFYTCFQGTIFSIKPIKFVNNMPVALSFNMTNNNKSKTETYYRELDAFGNTYLPNVRCHRTIIDKESHMTINESKIQSFDAEKVWANQVVTGGGSIKLKVLGRNRRIHKIGRKHMVMYNGRFISLSVAKKMDKEMRK